MFCKQLSFFIVLKCSPLAAIISSVPRVAPLSLSLSSCPFSSKIRFVDAVRLSFRQCIGSRPGVVLKWRFSWLSDGIPKVQEVFKIWYSIDLKKRCCKRGFAKKIGFDAVENPYRNSVACGTHSKRRYAILKKKYSILEPTFTNEHSYAFLNDFSEVARNRGD